MEQASLELVAQAAAFRRLVAHLQARPEVQNLDLMNLSGFCRNCLAKWLREEFERAGGEMSEADAKEAVYGMPYEAWKKAHQTPRPSDG